MGILRILGGLAIMAIGALMAIKSEWFLVNFGTIPWAEQHLGMDGGTRLFYKLLGILMALAGIFLATNLLGGILIGTVGKLFVPGQR